MRTGHRAEPINYDVDTKRGVIELYVNDLLLYSKGFNTREQRKDEMQRINKCLQGFTYYIIIKYYYRAKFSHAKNQLSNSD